MTIQHDWSIAAAFVIAPTFAVGRWLRGIARAYAARRQLAVLAEASDYMLKDIGLQRSDLRDAASLGFAADPTRLLAVRAVERRATRLPKAWMPAKPDTFREAA